MHAIYLNKYRTHEDNRVILNNAEEAIFTTLLRCDCTAIDN